MPLRRAGSSPALPTKKQSKEWAHMEKFISKIKIVEAFQWEITSSDLPRFRYHRGNADQPCPLCSFKLWQHGWVANIDDGDRVCPGDWVIIKGQQKQVCRKKEFEKNYMPTGRKGFSKLLRRMLTPAAITAGVLLLLFRR